MKRSCRSTGPCARFSTASGCQVSPIEISQEGHERDTLGGGQLGQTHIGVDLHVAQAVHEREPLRANMRELRSMLLERFVAVGIAVGVKPHPHLAADGFSRSRQRQGGGRRRLFRRGARGDELLPKRDVRGELPRRVLILQRLQLALQLPQGERHSQLRRHEERLDEKDRGNEGSDAREKQCEPQTRPTSSGRVRKNKCSALLAENRCPSSPKGANSLAASAGNAENSIGLFSGRPLGD